MPAHPLHPPAIGQHHIEHIKQHPFHLFSYASTSFCYILQVLLMVILSKSLIKKQTIIDAIYLIDCKFGHQICTPQFHRFGTFTVNSAKKESNIP